MMPHHPGHPQHNVLQTVEEVAQIVCRRVGGCALPVSIKFSFDKTVTQSSAVPYLWKQPPKTYCQSHFLNDEMFEKCAWPFSSKQTKVLATLVLILLGIVIFFHPIFFGRSVGKTSRAGETFAISLTTCHGKCNIMIYDMNRDLKPPLIRCRLYISSTNVFLSTKYKI